MNNIEIIVKQKLVNISLFETIQHQIKDIFDINLSHNIYKNFWETI